jgi:hypothetical protein
MTAVPSPGTPATTVVRLDRDRFEAVVAPISSDIFHPPRS